MKIPSHQKRPGAAPADGRGLRIAVVAARFNAPVTERLLDGCRRGLAECGVRARDISVTWMPGAFELPLAAQTLAQSKKYDAVITLGCILRGETPHDRYIAQATAGGVAQAALATGVPVMFGVLTPLSVAQARARAGTGTDNKGYEVAVAAVETARLLRPLRRGK
ncbi:MAG TPA: 6,7-dimethyl-8-ribityllumazine synthase [Elusimicrobiota bacterium]|nr:6,7-dimethyl-8-ribityllumazine synthase [Elusimicrobiota bacterium]